MSVIQVDLSKQVKPMKPMHGGGQPPMVAFNTLYQLGTQVQTVCDTDRLYALAASNGKRNAMMIANLTGETQTLIFEGVDFADARYYVLDQERLLSWASNANEIENNAVMLIE